MNSTSFSTGEHSDQDFGVRAESDFVHTEPNRSGVRGALGAHEGDALESDFGVLSESDFGGESEPEFLMLPEYELVPAADDAHSVRTLRSDDESSGIAGDEFDTESQHDDSELEDEPLLAELTPTDAKFVLPESSSDKMTLHIDLVAHEGEDENSSSSEDSDDAMDEMVEVKRAASASPSVPSLVPAASCLSGLSDSESEPATVLSHERLASPPLRNLIGVVAEEMSASDALAFLRVVRSRLSRAPYDLALYFRENGQAVQLDEDDTWHPCVPGVGQHSHLVIVTKDAVFDVYANSEQCKTAVRVVRNQVLGVGPSAPEPTAGPRRRRAPSPRPPLPDSFVPFEDNTEHRGERPFAFMRAQRRGNVEPVLRVAAVAAIAFATYKLWNAQQRPRFFECVASVFGKTKRREPTLFEKVVSFFS